MFMDAHTARVRAVCCSQPCCGLKCYYSVINNMPWKEGGGGGGDPWREKKLERGCDGYTDDGWIDREKGRMVQSKLTLMGINFLTFQCRHTLSIIIFIHDELQCKVWALSSVVTSGHLSDSGDVCVCVCVWRMQYNLVY